jgi:HEAT repeat protein
MAATPMKTSSSQLALWIVFILASAASARTQTVAEIAEHKILVELSQNVFVGKVVKAGTKEDTMAQFEIDVVLNIKGTLQGRTVVNQNLRRSFALIEPGATYLFASRYDTNSNLHLLMPNPNGNRLLSTNAALSQAQLESLARSDEAVIRWQEACKKYELLFAEAKDPAEKAIIGWLTSYRPAGSFQEAERMARDLKPILEQFGDQAALVIATRVEKGDPRMSNRRGVSLILRRLGNRAAPAVPILVRTLQQLRSSAPVDWPRFVEALAILSETGASASTLESIFALIPGPKSFLVFRYSIKPLTEMAQEGDAEIATRLDSFLAHADAHVRLAAAVTISRCFQPTERVTAIIRESLESFQPEATDYLLQTLNELNGDKSVFLPHLVALLKGPQPGTAMRSATALGQVGRAAIPTIMKCLTDDDPAIRKGGFTAFGTYVTAAKAEPDTWPLVTPVIAAVAQDSPREALRIIGLFPNQVRTSPEAGKVVRQLAESKDQVIKNQATRLLPRTTIPSAPLR